MLPQLLFHNNVFITILFHSVMCTLKLNRCHANFDCKTTLTMFEDQTTGGLNHNESCLQRGVRPIQH